MQTRKLYHYCGPVTMLGRLVSSNWAGTTLAASPQTARSNLEYQFKRQMGFIPSVRITLVGNLKEQ